MTDLVSPSSGPGRGEPVVHQLLYRSRSRNGASSALQMSDILAEARPANQREGITGVLTVVNGTFIQLVEGTDAALDRLMERLLRDSRHSDLVVLERRSAPVRMFGDWDMVSPRLAVSDVALLDLLLDDPSAGMSAYARILIHAVATQDRVLEGRRNRADPPESSPVAPRVTQPHRPGPGV